MRCYNTFPTQIWIGETLDIDNEILSKVILEKEKTEPNTVLSNSGGWQSSSDLHVSKSFGYIVDVVANNFKPIYEDHQYIDGMGLHVSSLWANVNRKTNFNTQHLHSHCDWSFCYYVKAPENCGPIIFVDPRVRRVMRPPGRLLKNRGEWDSNSPSLFDEYRVEPKEGKLIIFPSWLEHFVEPNLSDEPRISMSGNILLGIRVFPEDLPFPDLEM